MATAPAPNPAAGQSSARVPPQDLDAEMSLLGSMMLDRRAIESVVPVIQREESEWFYRPDHRLIFQLCSTSTIATRPST